MTLASELSLDAVLQRIGELAAQITGARYVALGVIAPEGGIREFVTVGVTSEQREHIGDLPVGRGILGLLITEARTIRIPDEKQGAPEFTDEDERSVEVLAAQAGVAIENATARRELERLALMEDRERIAKELQDGVIQSLFAVGMGLQAIATLSKDRAIEHRIEEAVGEVDHVIRNLRNYIFGLRPGILADRELDQARNTFPQVRALIWERTTGFEPATPTLAILRRSSHASPSVSPLSLSRASSSHPSHPSHQIAGVDAISLEIRWCRTPRCRANRESG